MLASSDVTARQKIKPPLSSVEPMNFRENYEDVHSASSSTVDTKLSDAHLSDNFSERSLNSILNIFRRRGLSLFFILAMG